MRSALAYLFVGCATAARAGASAAFAPSHHCISRSQTVPLPSACSLRMQLRRRPLLAGATSWAVAAAAAQAELEGMRTSQDMNDYASVTGSASAAPLGLGTMAGKSRPETGVKLRSLSEVQQTSDGTVFAELVLGCSPERQKGREGGLPVLTKFRSPWPVARGMMYDVEVRNKMGDSAFLQVQPLPEQQQLANLPNSFFLDTILDKRGRFGAYGVATDAKVLRSSVQGEYRVMEIAFNALTPSYNEVPRRAFIASTTPDGATDVVMMVASSTAARWKQSVRAEAQGLVDSFQVTSQ